MKKSTLLATVLVSACAAQGPPPEPPPVRTVNATVRATAGTPNVRATAQAHSVAGRTAVGVNLAGGTPGSTHPWHIHVGRCETNGPIFGAASAYPPLRPDGSGNATATAMLDVELGSTESYFVNVHESPQNLGRIIACGDLR